MAVTSVRSESFPLLSNEFLCYIEEKVVRTGMISIESYFDNGEKTVSYMSGGLRNGPGIYIWPDGARYEGEFKND